MTMTAEALIAQIRELEMQVEEAIAARRAEFGYRIEKGRLEFDAELAKRQKELKAKLLPYVTGAPPLVLLSIPFIYSLIFPIVLLDIFVTIYQAVCFPIYHINKVKRRDYIIFDRHRLAFLNIVEKINCAYCSYGNGVFAYASEVAARTEQYWCPLKHARRMAGAHRHYADFVDFGDAEGYKQRLAGLRNRLHDEM